MNTGGSGLDAASLAAPGWVVRHRRGTAAELHALDVSEPTARAVWILEPDRPALVLGSTQHDEVADASVLADRGIDLVRRRSGGGAVLLDPVGSLGGGCSVWVDLVIGRSDPLWVDDVGRSMGWLGDTWRAALGSLGIDAAVHRGRLDRTAASALVCFAGVGPGEVLVDGRKAIGISQRRTRAGARFQCLGAVTSPTDTGAPHPPATFAVIGELLAAPPGRTERDELAAAIELSTVVLEVSADDLVAALLASLPS